MQKISEVSKALITENVSLSIMAQEETKFGKLQIQALLMVSARIKHNILYNALLHGNKAKLKRPFGLIGVQIELFNF